MPLMVLLALRCLVVCVLHPFDIFWVLFTLLFLFPFLFSPTLPAAFAIVFAFCVHPGRFRSLLLLQNHTTTKKLTVRKSMQPAPVQVPNLRPPGPLYHQHQPQSHPQASNPQLQMSPPQHHQNSEVTIVPNHQTHVLQPHQRLPSPQPSPLGPLQNAPLSPHGVMMSPQGLQGPGAAAHVIQSQPMTHQQQTFGGPMGHPHNRPQQSHIYVNAGQAEVIRQHQPPLPHQSLQPTGQHNHHNTYLPDHPGVGPHGSGQGPNPGPFSPQPTGAQMGNYQNVEVIRQFHQGGRPVDPQGQVAGAQAPPHPHHMSPHHSHRPIGTVAPNTQPPLQHHLINTVAGTSPQVRSHQLGNTLLIILTNKGPYFKCHKVCHKVTKLYDTLCDTRNMDHNFKNLPNKQETFSPWDIIQLWF